MTWLGLWLLLGATVVTTGMAYVYQFSITQPFAPEFVQYSEIAIGALPFGFSSEGRVTVEWEPWSVDQWNSSRVTQNSAPFGGFFVDHAGHWRPPLSWRPSQAPQEYGVGWCRVEQCLPPLQGSLVSVSSLLSRGDLHVLGRWNASEPFEASFKVSSGHSVVVIWAIRGQYSNDLVELEHMTLTLTNGGDLEGGTTQLTKGQLGLPELYAAFVAVWGFALCSALANQWLRRRVSTSRHVWYLMVLLCIRIIQLSWACALWWTLQLRGYLSGYSVLFASFGQVVDFWLRLAWTVGACVLALDAPIVSTSKPARTVLVWMLLVALVAAFASVTFADLTWWLWGAMLMWSDVAFQIAFTVSLVWLFRLDAQRLELSGKRPKFSDRTKYCWGAFSLTTTLPMAYVKILLVADTLRASPVWYRGDYLAHFALVEVSHALFAVWLFMVVTARVARDDMRARAFIPLSETEMMSTATTTTTTTTTTSITSIDNNNNNNNYNDDSVADDIELQAVDPVVFVDPLVAPHHEAVSVSRPSDYSASEGTPQ